MAIDANSFDPNDPENQQGTGQNINLGPQGGIVQGQVGPSGGSATNPQAASSPSSSGMNYTGLNQYLNANQNAGTTMGNQIAGNVNSGTTQAGNQAQNLYGQFNNDLSQSTAFSNPNAVSQFVANPTGVDPSITQQTQSTLQGAANYQAPVFNNESGYNTSASGVQNAQNQANQLQNSQGQYQLLNQYFGNPSYSQGQQNLDQALIGSSNGAQTAFNQAMQNAQNLGTQWNNLNTQAAGAAQQAGQTVNQNAQNAFNTISGAANTDLQNYNNTLAQDNAAQTAAYTADQNLLKSMGQTPTSGSMPSPTLIHSGGAAGTGGAYANPMTTAQVNANPQLSQLLSSLGAAPGVDSVNAPGTQNPYTGYFGVNPNSYFTANPALQIQNTTTANQQQQLNALQQMIGQNPQFSQANQSATQYDPTALPGSLQPGFSSAVQNAMGTFNQGLAPLQAAANATGSFTPGLLGTPGQTVNSQTPAYQNLNDYLNNYGLASVSSPGTT